MDLSQNTYIYLLVAALTIYAIRALPLTLIQKEIQSTFIRSFLYYVPYVTLAVMAFPAIITATETPISGVIAFITAVLVSWMRLKGKMGYAGFHKLFTNIPLHCDLYGVL